MAFACFMGYFIRLTAVFSLFFWRIQGGAQGQAEDIKVEAAQVMRVRDNLVKMYSMMTGQTQDQIVRDLDRDNFMSAQEALEYGLIDRVLDYNKETDTQL